MVEKCQILPLLFYCFFFKCFLVDFSLMCQTYFNFILCAASVLHHNNAVHVVLCSVKYEDPQALGGLASALDVRQQNTGGVSTLIHGF